jgi:hypothetical protein
MLRVASRIDTGPAPQRAFRSSQRFAVKTRQSNSGVAKLMRAEPWGLPVVHARVKSAIESAGFRTSRVTVFIVPPQYILQEIRDQLFRRREYISAFFSAEMPMIAFASFIVVTQSISSTHDVRQPVFKLV